MSNNTLKIGQTHERMSEKEEIAVLKEKNGKRTLVGGLPGEMYHGSYTGGIGKSIWQNKNTDWIAFRNVINRYFINLFEWDGEDVSNQFRRELENILFRHGMVAVYKTPDGEFFPAQFTYTKEDWDYYGEPTRITLVHTNETVNGTVLTEGNFVIIYNNSLKHGTLDFLNERMRQTIRALKDVDNASLLSRPKWGINIAADDAAIDDIENAMNSDKAFIPMGNIDFADMDIQDLSKDDVTKERIEGFDFQLNTLLKLVGLQVSDNGEKKVKLTQMELQLGNQFGQDLIGDMYEMRLETIDALKELGMKIDLGQMVEEEVVEENNAMIEKEVDNEQEQE